MNKLIVSLLLTVGISGVANAAGDATAGQAKAAVCGACHGPDGKASVPIYPHLAGQNQAYLLKQMKAFKEGARTEPLMVPFMAMLTEADMENLAAYYASLK